ncbi:MAG: chloramphenicol phosphotransferase [Dehalococcoidia bacterium]
MANPQVSPNPVIIHFIGSPAVGKYTIASKVAPVLPARLVDNHSIANVIFNVLDQDGIRPLPPGVWSHVSQVRRAVLDAMIELSPPHLSFVFTNYLRGGDPAEEVVFEELRALAEVRRSAFVPVLLSCATDEVMRRVVRPDRRERMKLVDPGLAREFNEGPRFTTSHPNTLELDVTHLPPEESAARIVAWANACRRSETTPAQ